MECLVCKKRPRLKTFRNGRERELSYCRECNLSRCKEWYKKNKEYKINKTKDHQKRNNYSSEKTEKQRNLRSIKRKTRFMFPLTGKKCAYCGKTATERHHNEYPIVYDKFVFCCHSCHIIKHNEKGGIENDK